LYRFHQTTVKRIDPALVLGPVRPLEALTPSLHAHTLLWFERTQLPRLHRPGQPLPCWLHGFATRREAEQLLQDKPQGSFLLRLSESKIGFVLSYRGEDRCRHFIIEEDECGSPGSVYLIAGEHSRHRSLDDLISYYTRNPVGPFNEMLTVPCMQGDIKDDFTHDFPRNGKAIDQEEQTRLPMAIGPAVLNSLPTNPSKQTTSATEESVQYAAVRKPLKKTHSLPECKYGTETAPPGLEVIKPGSEVAERPSNLNLTGDQASPVDVPYARVNKPPRAVSENTPNFSAQPDLQGVTAAITTPSIPNSDTTADPKYWKLEPMHTYEETPHTRSRPEEIDCYAVGWRRQAAVDEGEKRGKQNHLYSEVNIKGAQEGYAVPRPGPSLPLRPPPRSSFGVSPMMTQPQHSGFHHSEQPNLNASSSSIYEQIPERPTSSRACLPPPNPKR
uniref:Si:ch73-109i22.2 n=1 Tax=Sinocyclocheilus rhinocerous TaxID=307959 RepID=A0A673G3B1_9TELE